MSTELRTGRDAQALISFDGDTPVGLAETCATLYALNEAYVGLLRLRHARARFHVKPTASAGLPRERLFRYVRPRGYRRWRDEQEQSQLGQALVAGRPACPPRPRSAEHADPVIGLKLGRTPDAVQSQASRQGVSLKPTNQTPYNRGSK
jgi:hypothetical protein